MDRYIPGYVYFGGGVKQGYDENTDNNKRPPWNGMGLEILLEEGRGVVDCCTF